MKIREIYEILDEIAPFEAQEKWDNSGILIGNLDSEISGKIYLSLDLDSALVDETDENSLFIIHHPLIFKGLKSINPAKYPSNLIYKLIAKNCSLIAMHTNFDKYILNKGVASRILKYEIVEEREFLVSMKSEFSFDELCVDVKKKLGISNLRVVKSHNRAKKIALCTGSGAELLENLDDIDCFLTGDLKYHIALESLENGVNLIDINHFESERYFGEFLAPFLQKFQNQVIIAGSINPFTYC